MTTRDAFNDLKPGTEIGGKYRLVRLLGEGAYGAVYEARNMKTTRQVAVKLLNPALSGELRVVKRFVGDAQAATRLAHPNIVDVLDLDTDPKTGMLFIVLEFLKGKDLREYLTERKTIQPVETAEILVPVMAALALAHEQGIVHRDIKPENIFLHEASGGIVPTLIDFGVAKMQGQPGEPHITSTGTPIGTPHYMSPEQVRGVRDLDGRSDVWAMGVVMFEMISGRVPFDERSYFLLVTRIASERPPRIESFAPDTPPEVAEVIHRAIEPDLNKRFPSMHAMLDAVLACPGFEHVNRRSTLRERHAAAIEHRPPVESIPVSLDIDPLGRTVVDDHSLQTTSAVQPSSNALTNEPKRPPRLGLWVGVSLAGTLALGSAAWRATQPPPQNTPQSTLQTTDASIPPPAIQRPEVVSIEEQHPATTPVPLDAATNAPPDARVVDRHPPHDHHRPDRPRPPRQQDPPFPQLPVVQPP